MGMSIFGANVAAAEIKANKSFVFVNPCHRGPLPRVNIINTYKDQFIAQLTQVYPQLSYYDATYVAFQLCADTALYGDNQALTARLHRILSQNRFGGIEPTVRSDVRVQKSFVATSNSTALRKSSVLQLGLFAKEGNADKTIAALNRAGLTAQKKPTYLNNRKVWSVATLDLTSQENVAKAKRIARSLGITDAYLKP